MILLVKWACLDHLGSHWSLLQASSSAWPQTSAWRRRSWWRCGRHKTDEPRIRGFPKFVGTPKRLVYNSLWGKIAMWKWMMNRGILLFKETSIWMPLICELLGFSHSQKDPKSGLVLVDGTKFCQAVVLFVGLSVCFRALAKKEKFAQVLTRTKLFVLCMLNLQICTVCQFDLVCHLFHWLFPPHSVDWTHHWLGAQKIPCLWVSIHQRHVFWLDTTWYILRLEKSDLFLTRFFGNGLNWKKPI